MRALLARRRVCLQSPPADILPDIDECKSGEPCGPNSRCHNSNGAFYCTCQRDYTPTSGTQHFHPDTGAGCKGQWRNWETHKDTLTHSFSIYLLWQSSKSAIFYIFFNSFIFFKLFIYFFFSFFLLHLAELHFFFPSPENPLKRCHDDGECVTRAVNSTLQHVSGASSPSIDVMTLPSVGDGRKFTFVQWVGNASEVERDPR